jgi:hypothetical protein
MTAKGQQNLDQPNSCANQTTIQQTEEPNPTRAATLLIESPILMESAIMEQGQELHEVMRLFRQATTTPLSACVLQTSTQKKTIVDDKIEIETEK